MNGEQLKQKVNSGGIVYGTMISLGRNPRWSPAFSNFGIDYAILDTEHSARSRSEVADYLAAFNYSGAVSYTHLTLPTNREV